MAGKYGVALPTGGGLPGGHGGPGDARGPGAEHNPLSDGLMDSLSRPCSIVDQKI